MKRAMSLLAALIAVACSDGAGPGGLTDLQLSIMQQAAAAPPLLAARDSFWAKVGDGREVRLFYQGVAPGDTGEEFLRFEVSGSGLYRKPDGSAFGVNDSILITVSVVDPARFLFEFAPAGLRFNPNDPARLRVHYEHGDKDLDDDGDVDTEDDELESLVDLWYRADAAALWFRVGSVHFEEADELDALIRTFSQYAVAW